MLFLNMLDYVLQCPEHLEFINKRIMWHLHNMKINA